MLFLVTKYSFSDIKNLIELVILKNKYGFPKMALSKYHDCIDIALKNIEEFQKENILEKIER
jgi:hypothetical protein